jgi:type I restriction enzyme S subunit
MVVPGELSSCVFESNMMRLRVSDELNAGWVIAVLQTATGRDRLTANAKWAVNQASINQQDVRRTAVPLPPRAEHLRVLNAIDEHLSDTLHVLGEVEEAGARSDRLRQSILRQAFEGSLVQHDPADEPASVLLDRIRKERAANLTAGPVRQRRPRSVKVGSK